MARLKKFYQSVELVKNNGEYQLKLDGRLARTPSKAPLAVAGQVYAKHMQAEWQRQDDFIDPTDMPFTRLANSAIDGVRQSASAVADEIAAYAHTDLVFYRACTPARLVALQARYWDPVLEFMRARYGAHFYCTDGMNYINQPQDSVAKIAAIVQKFSNHALALAGLQVMTSITGSVLIALAATGQAVSMDDAWSAAHVDEDWNSAQWGDDVEAKARRAHLYQTFYAAFVATSLTAETKEKL